MAQLTDGFKDIFLAGIGAMAIGGEKAKEIVDQLIEKGELTVEQGKQVSGELAHKATEQAEKMGEGVLEASMKAMTPEQRARFVERAAELAREMEAEAVVEEPAVEGEAEAETETEKPAEA